MNKLTPAAESWIEHDYKMMREIIGKHGTEEYRRGRRDGLETALQDPELLAAQELYTKEQVQQMINTYHQRNELLQSELNEALETINSLHTRNDYP